MRVRKYLALRGCLMAVKLAAGQALVLEVGDILRASIWNGIIFQHTTLYTTRGPDWYA